MEIRWFLMLTVIKLFLAIFLSTLTNELNAFFSFLSFQKSLIYRMPEIDALIQLTGRESK